MTPLLPLLLAYPTALKETTRPIRFEYVADRAVKSVAVAGTFNNWNNAANPMTLEADGRTWSLTLPLPYGRHQYKFVRDGEWIVDPNAPKQDDGNGNVNSILLVLPPDYKAPARLGDGEIATSTLRHEPRAPFVNYDRGKLRLVLEARPDDIQKVAVVANGKSHEMRLVGEGELIARYAVEVRQGVGREALLRRDRADGRRIDVHPGSEDLHAVRGAELGSARGDVPDLPRSLRGR